LLGVINIVPYTIHCTINNTPLARLLRTAWDKWPLYAARRRLEEAGVEIAALTGIYQQGIDPLANADGSNHRHMGL
jgi:hypothetical protein